MASVAATNASPHDPHTLPKVSYPPPAGAPPKPARSAFYSPPTAPPPGHPHLVDFTYLSPDQVCTLYSQGYARVHLPLNHPLLVAATTLLSTSRNFFAQPLEHKEKFHPSRIHENVSQSSEEGWSRVEGEKEMFTARRIGTLCPPEITNDVRQAWEECGKYMQDSMHAIEASLDLQPGAFDNLFVEECTLPVDKTVETLLRMFRYERTAEARLVATHHKDLGFLSLVIGSSPGLDVWDDTSKKWVAIEEGADPRDGPTFTLLTGQCLYRLTNSIYKAGVHRVFVPPADAASSTDDAKYRYSLVFALRPHRSGIISTSALTSNVTGEHQWPIEGVPARELFSAIGKLHWSVNLDQKELGAQKIRNAKYKEQFLREVSEGQISVGNGQ
ncbi:Clavaminate synthase-like protein [Athelia psychrophila]|uniref:Clavaminate synthase-like protein n=1 Tax=Athelia psychrophila TaxID=1759441 RepID=A0A166VJF4_9AGAM|nr:Clavaminate synthase-like protein [Fibularhizoctonia sp. CBS 109695]